MGLVPFLSVEEACMSLLLLLQGGLEDLVTLQVIVIVRRAGQDLAVPVSL
jgi:hypothetical protein